MIPVSSLITKSTDLSVHRLSPASPLSLRVIVAANDAHKKASCLSAEKQPRTDGEAHVENSKRH